MSTGSRNSLALLGDVSWPQSAPPSGDGVVNRGMAFEFIEATSPLFLLAEYPWCICCATAVITSGADEAGIPPALLNRGALVSFNLEVDTSRIVTLCSVGVITFGGMMRAVGERTELTYLSPPILCSDASELLIFSCFFHLVRRFWNQIFTCRNRTRQY